MRPPQSRLARDHEPASYRVVFVEYKPSRPGWTLIKHLLLFLVTFSTMTLNGAFLAGHHPFLEIHAWEKGLPFAFALMSIMLCHEFGHFLVARYHGVPTSLPYFFPAPPLFIGTFGAFIRLGRVPRTRAALFDVGAAGPWAGVLVAIVVLVIGLQQSMVRPPVSGEAGVGVGNCILMHALVRLVVGTIPEGQYLYLHPVAFAGWAGLFLTLVNLTPSGQLDGGHVAYAFDPAAHPIVARFVVCGLAYFGFVLWLGWIPWALLLLVLGVDHPPTKKDSVPLGVGRTALALATMALYLALLMPVPLRPFTTDPPEQPAAEVSTASDVGSETTKRRQQVKLRVVLPIHKFESAS